MKKLLTILSVVGLILVGSGPAGAGELWGTGSPDWAYALSGPSPVIFKFDTSTGLISKKLTFETYNWMWISGLADSGKYLYASHNIYDLKTEPRSTKTHDFKIAKIDRSTGAVLSDTFISGYLGHTWSQVNALDFKDGKLYAVENVSDPNQSAFRGYALEVKLDTNGDVVGATQGAFVGPYPDCGLDYYNGLWYATSWGYTPLGKEGSIVYTSPDIMSIPFTQVGTGNSAVEGIGMVDGWEFDKAGNLFAVSWYWVPASPTAVYSINTNTWTATSLYDLSSQLSASITSLDGLSEIIPSYSCSGFEPPCNSGPIMVKKNRVIPLKAQLLNESGLPVTNADIPAPPVLQVMFQSGTSVAIDVTADALSAGQGTEGNLFIYSDGKWQFNLQTKNYIAKGIYTITMVSGDVNEYIINPSCTATFVIK